MIISMDKNIYKNKSKLYVQRRKFYVSPFCHYPTLGRKYFRQSLSLKQLVVSTCLIWATFMGQVIYVFINLLVYLEIICDTLVIINLINGTLKKTLPSFSYQIYPNIFLKIIFQFCIFLRTPGKLISIYTKKWSQMFSFKVHFFNSHSQNNKNILLRFFFILKKVHSVEPALGDCKGRNLGCCKVNGQWLRLMAECLRLSAVFT